MANQNEQQPNHPKKNLEAAMRLGSSSPSMNSQRIKGTARHRQVPV